MTSFFRNKAKAASSSGSSDFELIFRSYFTRLCAFATVYTNSLEDSKEVVQEVFLKVWEKRNELPLDDELKSYLFRAVKNACINRLQHQMVADRYQAVLYFLHSQEPGTDGYTEIELGELQGHIDTAIAALPESCRNIFLLSRNQGLKYREIAEQLNISVKTVETQMSRALLKLKSQLHEYL